MFFFSVGDVEIWSRYDITNLVFSRALAAKRCIYSDTTLHSEHMFSMPNLVKNSEVSKLYGVWHDLECTVPPTEATMIQTHQKKNTAKSVTSSNKQLLIHPSFCWVVRGMIRVCSLVCQDLSIHLASTWSVFRLHNQLKTARILILLALCIPLINQNFLDPPLTEEVWHQTKPNAPEIELQTVMFPYQIKCRPQQSYSPGFSSIK